jgi:hypothetical protein
VRKRQAHRLADFAAKANDLEKAAAALAEAAKGGDKATMVGGARAVGKACIWVPR